MSEQDVNYPGRAELDESRSQDPMAFLLDGQHRPVHPNYVPFERIGGIISAVIISILLGIAAIFLILYFHTATIYIILIVSVTGLLIITLFVFYLLWPSIDYRYRSFAVSDKGIEIRKGVYFRRVMNVPGTRIQHTDINQGPIERRFGLSHLVIHTAGTVGAMVTLEGLDSRTAMYIRDHLINIGECDAV